MRVMARAIAFCAALLLAWPAVAGDDQKGKAGDKEVGAVVEEGELPPGSETPPVQGGPPPEESKPGQPGESAEPSQ